MCGALPARNSDWLIGGTHSVLATHFVPGLIRLQQNVILGAQPRSEAINLPNVYC
jgi:hypothetical protein